MRLPSEAQLSEEQRDICFARAEGTTLVTGPPGSGKTVVAHFRAKRLASRGESVSLVMYNHVLRSFTGRSETTTFLSWIGKWWERTVGRRMPKTQRVVRNRTRWEYDFAAAMEMARTEYAGKIRARGNWGHLIVDEAQDFSQVVHQFLFTIPNLVFRGTAKPPSLMVLADENQRIGLQNATIARIRDAHLLDAKDEFKLTQNYRNTRPIAELAASFYVGLETGMPDLPERDGDKPVLIWSENLETAVKRIVSYAKLNSDQEIGVLVFHNKTRKKLVNKLKHRLSGDGIPVQTSHSGEPKLAEKLRFDDGGRVSVFTFASSKGLEFDTVFLPEMQGLPLDSNERDIMRMNLYVMISRARSHLYMLASCPPRSEPLWGFLGPAEHLFDQEGE